MRIPDSIILRTSLLFALLTAIVIFTMGIVVRVAIDHHFAEMDQEQMAGKLELIQHVLADLTKTSQHETVREELDRAMVGHNDLLVRIDDSAGNLWYRSGHTLIPDSEKMSSSWQIDGIPFRGMHMISASGFHVSVGVDVSHHDEFLKSFEWELAMIGICGLATMALFGFLVTQKGLVPLQDMTNLVTNISAQQLGDRLSVDSMPIELRNLAKAFNDMLNRIGDSLNRLSEFSSDLAHEFRTPLNNLMLQSQVSLSKHRTAEEYREALYANFEECESLARMVTDMLFLAKADNGLIIPHREIVNLDKEVQSLCEFYGVIAEEKQVKISISGAATCSGDVIMLKRAIGNLVANALQHAYTNTVVFITMEETESSAIVTVSNDGDAIAPEHLPRIFDRFYRADTSRAKQDDGVGLGLAIVKSIAKAHGGEVSVKSFEGKTSFIIKLSVTN